MLSPVSESTQRGAPEEYVNAPRQHLTISYTPDLLSDPSAATPFTEKLDDLDNFEKFAVRAAVREELGFNWPLPERTSRPDATRLLSFGAQTLTSTQPTWHDRLAVDKENGCAVITSGTSGSPEQDDRNGRMVATVAGQAFLQAAALERLADQLDTPETVDRLGIAAEATDGVIANIKDRLGEGYEHANATLAAMQLLPGRRLGVLNAGDSAVIVVDSTGQTKRLTVEQTHDGELYNYLDGGPITDEADGFGPRGSDEQIIHQLQPGYNVAILASKKVADALDGLDLFTEIDQLDLDFESDPDIGGVIARRLVAIAAEYQDESEDPTDDDGSALVMVLDAPADPAEPTTEVSTPFVDERPEWQRKLDAVRPSQIALRGLVRWRNRGENYREVYEKLPRWVRRSIAATETAVATVGGGYALYKLGSLAVSLTRNVLAAKGHGVPHMPSQSGTPIEPTGSDTPPPTHLPPTETHQPTAADYDRPFVAQSHNPETGRADNVYDQARSAYQDALRADGFSEAEVNAAGNNQVEIDKLMGDFYHDNQSVADHPKHYEIAGYTYHNGTMNLDAHNDAAALKAQLHPSADPTPAANPTPAAIAETPPAAATAPAEAAIPTPPPETPIHNPDPIPVQPVVPSSHEVSTGNTNKLPLPIIAAASATALAAAFAYNRHHQHQAVLAYNNGYWQSEDHDTPRLMATKDGSKQVAAPRQIRRHRYGVSKKSYNQWRQTQNMANVNRP